MNVTFVGRTGLESQVIGKTLLELGLIQTVVFESGAIAKQRKLHNLWRQRSWLGRLILPLDLFFLWWMSESFARAVSREYKSYSQFPAHYQVQDINDPTCLEFLRQQNPDFLLVYGTAILRETALGIPKQGVLNIHGGIVPKYRNVHSEFWALAEGHPEEVGSSILVMDKGIDSGAVVVQSSCSIHQAVPLSQAKLQNFKLALALVTEILRQHPEGNIPSKPQGPSAAKKYATPTFLDWLRSGVKLS